jgi:hypothetical protein
MENFDIPLISTCQNSGDGKTLTCFVKLFHWIFKPVSFWTFKKLGLYYVIQTYFNV